MPLKETKAPRAKADTAGTTEEIKLVRTGDLNDVSDALYALNDLQLKRDETIHPLSLTYALQSLHRSLPEYVQGQVSIAKATLSDELFGDIESGDFENLLVRKFKNGVSKRGRDFAQKFRQSEYLFWPVQSDTDHWTTVILHLGRSGQSADNFDTVFDFAVVDASRSEVAAARVGRVVSRLKRLLEYIDLDFRTACEHQIWVPPQAEENDWESGLRSFQLIRQLLDRVTDIFCSSGSLNASLVLGTPTKGWLNVDFVRHEMIAMVLERCNDRMGYACRYALEPIQDVRLEDKGTFSPDCLAPRNEDKMAYIPGTDIVIEDDYEEEENEEAGTCTIISNDADEAELGDIADAAMCDDNPVDKDFELDDQFDQKHVFNTSPSGEGLTGSSHESPALREGATNAFQADTNSKRSKNQEDLSDEESELVTKRAKTIDTGS